MAPSLPAFRRLLCGKTAVFPAKSTRFMNFAILWKPSRTPGLSISRILTREGAAVPGGRACRDQTPAPRWVRSVVIGWRLIPSGRGSACTAHASCCGPRTASHHHGAGPHDPRPLPSRICPASYTPHTTGAPAGTVYWPYAMQRYSHDRQRTALLPGAAPCGLHSIWSRTVSAPGSRDACTGPSVS